MNYRILPNGDTVASPNELPAMLAAEEGFFATSGPLVYDDEAPATNGNIGHNPTIGYGFNLRDQNVLALVLENITYNGVNVFTQASNTPISNIVAAFESLIGQYPANSFANQHGISGALSTLLGSYWNLSSSQSANLFQISKATAQSILGQIINGYTVGTFTTQPSIYQALTNYLTANGVSAGNVPPPNSAEALALASLFYNTHSLLGPRLRAALQNGNRAQVWYQIRYQSNAGGIATPGNSFYEGIAKRRDYESQVFNLSSSTDSIAQAYQNYEMLTENRAQIISYEHAFGEAPGQPAAMPDEIQAADFDYKLSTVLTSPVSQAVQNLVQTFNADAEVIAQNINSTYAYLSPKVNVSTDLQGTIANDFNVGSTDILLAPSQSDLTAFFASGTQKDVNAGAADPGVDNHIVIGVTDGDTLTGGVGGDIIIAGAGNETLNAGTGSETLIGGQGNDLLNGNSGVDVFDVEFGQNSNPASAVETIVDTKGWGSIYINGNQLGKSAVQFTGVKDTWQDGTYQYQFNGNTDVLAITPLAGDLVPAGTVDIQGFNLLTAETSPFGFLGINIPYALNLTAGATVGTDPPATFPAGSSQSYTLSVGEAIAAAQTITVTLGGAIPSDFEATVGNTVEQLNANGSFNVTLGAGETNVAFGLVDTTADNGSSDIASGATLTLSATLPNLANPSGSLIQSTPLTFNYIPGAPDTTQAPNPGDVISGQYDSGSGITTYTGDGGDDSIAASGSNNLINAQNSGNDSIIGGSGTNTINGSAGNNVISFNGTQDTVVLGSGFNTVIGGTGHDTIFGSANGGDDIVSGGGGTDVIVLGNGNNEIYANSKTILAQAIAHRTRRLNAPKIGIPGPRALRLSGWNLGGNGTALPQ
jgi:Ca2+-binding RTX toxin-like protein